jgi:hypothetical protein
LQSCGLNSGPSPWDTPPALFLWRVFQDRVLWTICLGWFWTVILLISTSWVARIIGVSHWCLAWRKLLESKWLPVDRARAGLDWRGQWSGQQRTPGAVHPEKLAFLSDIWEQVGPSILV